MTDKEKRTLKDGVINLIGKFKILEHGIVEVLENNILSFIDSMQEEPVSEELEKAALQHGIDNFPSLCNGCKHVPVDAFKVGANWREEQLMAKAVDGTARPDDNEIWCNLASRNFKDGDKVKVIVIKEG